MRYIVVAGTRPEIIKTAPIIRRILELKEELYFVHTGQHFDYSLSEQIINDLELPDPHLSFELRSLSPASQIAEIMTKLEAPTSPDSGIVVVQGDTNSVLAAALTAVKKGLPVAHVEAGLRSRDWRMPEEHNRRMVDHISNLLFAPTPESAKNLVEEHVFGKTYVVGNTVIDAVNQHLPFAEKKSDVMTKIRFPDYVLATFHRAENVDDRKTLTEIVLGLLGSNLPIVLPLHPRTKKRLVDYNLYERLESSKNIQILLPQGYLDFLVLLKHCRFIVTDSGGIQEEATAPSLSKKVLVARLSTERPEAVDSGHAELLEMMSAEMTRKMKKEWNKALPLTKESPYGDGTSSRKIMDILKSYEERSINEESVRTNSAGNISLAD
jgi:UDP-N-acetylglucosamine 2-epimerase (non-hydrolysing)